MTKEEYLTMQGVEDPKERKSLLSSFRKTSDLAEYLESEELRGRMSLPGYVNTLEVKDGN